MGVGRCERGGWRGENWWWGELGSEGSILDMLVWVATYYRECVSRAAFR